ncbi:MAG: hypothetical protein JWM95_143 [Gemmatimonadetes bacterium]|nr:hypothetical protein [Gemmatimonadota bacterium]
MRALALLLVPGYPPQLSMTSAFRSIFARTPWFRRLGRFMAMVTQLVVLLAPLAENHSERQLGAHVEGPRSVPHPGQHNSDSCPACQLISLHGRASERAQLPDVVFVVSANVSTTVAHPSGATLLPSNTSRAPPVSP